MTTVTNNTNTNSTDKKNTVVCVCCLAFFPVLYLVGSTVMTMIG